MGVSSPWGNEHKQELEEQTRGGDRELRYVIPTTTQLRRWRTGPLLRGGRWIEDVLQADHLTGEEEDLADCPRPSAAEDTEDQLGSKAEGPDGEADLLPHH